MPSCNAALLHRHQPSGQDVRLRNNRSEQLVCSVLTDLSSG
jgi:hypothetical protein